MTIEVLALIVSTVCLIICIWSWRHARAALKVARKLDDIVVPQPFTADGTPGKVPTEKRIRTTNSNPEKKVRVRNSRINRRTF